MKEVFEEIVNSCKRNILFYTLVYMILFLLSKVILHLFGLQYRQFMNYFSAILILIGIIASVIQMFLHSKTKDTRTCIIICSVSIFILFMILSPIILLFIAFIPSEHVVERENKKYVAYVSSFLDTRVTYYDYVNFFLLGNTKRIEEFYNNIGIDILEENVKDSYEPTSTTYYDENEKVVQQENSNSTKNTEFVIAQQENNNTLVSSNDDDILYEKRINENIIIRVKNLGAILAQRSIIGVEKSVDGGKTYIRQDNEGITIHNGAKFVFLDENIGFINDPGLAGTDGENRGLLVTIDGGKTFQDANLIHPDNIEEKNLFVYEVPYIDNGILKVKIYTINHSKEPEKTYYTFYSNDNGLNWNLEN